MPIPQDMKVSACVFPSLSQPLVRELGEVLLKLTVSAETQTLFRSGWIQSTSVWLRPGVEEMLEGACAIRDSFLSSIPGKNPAKYDLTIAIKPGLLFELMEVNHGSVNGKDVGENTAGCKSASPALWVVRSSVRLCIAKLKILQYAAKLANLSLFFQLKNEMFVLIRCTAYLWSLNEVKCALSFENVFV